MLKQLLPSTPLHHIYVEGFGGTLDRGSGFKQKACRSSRIAGKLPPDRTVDVVAKQVAMLGLRRGSIVQTMKKVLSGQSRQPVLWVGRKG